MGENSQNIYVTTSLGMVGGDAANQVVNLLTGFKAMLTLTRPDQADLIAPLTAQCKDKEVTLQWTWPSSKLPELIDRLDLKDQSDEDESPTTRPVATQPAH
jgi:hypothetical protein